MKKRFDFEPIDTLVDVFVDGHKVLEKHNGRRGNVSVHANDNTEVELRPHDPRIPIQAKFSEDGKLIILEQVPVQELPPVKATMKVDKPSERKDFV